MTATLVALGLARGTLVHLAGTGAAQTLCGRRHGINPRYVTAGRFTLPAEAATCPKCKALA